MAVFETGELQATVANADGAVEFGRTADGIEGFEFVQQGFGFGREVRRCVNRREAGLEVAEILGVDFTGGTMGVEAKEPGAEGFAGEPAKAVSGEIAGGFGQEQAERGVARDAAAGFEVVMPDEREGEEGGFVGGIGTGDGGKGVGATDNFCARKDGGKRMLQIEGGGKRFDFPAWELALEHAAELFGEILALAHTSAVDGLRAVEIEEGETAGFAAEFLNGAIEDAGGVAFDGEDAAGDAAGFVPNFDREAAGADFEGVGTFEQREGIFAIFESGGAAAGGEKGLDGDEEEFGIGGNCRVQLR